MIRLAACLAVLGFPAFAQAPDDPSPAVAAILSQAVSECAKYSETGQPKPRLIYLPGAFTWMDLDGEFEPNDLVLDFNNIYCSSFPGLWAGSGGSMVSIAVSGENGDFAETWAARGWRRVEYNGVSIILLSRHGSYCDSYGARACVIAITVDNQGFSMSPDAAPTGFPWE
ncbi:MAG: hypothetical protein AAGP08_05960 [Pseudomonadota bacterium]